MSNKFEKDSLGTRMKTYEDVSRHYLTRRSCIIVRVDGKAFHSFTKSFDRPFDKKLIQAMQGATAVVAEQMQGFKLAYIQSDEASFLLTDFDDIVTEAWFDNNLNKIITVAASTMTAYFNYILALNNNMRFPLGVFDARAFVIPNEEVSNYFLWRSKDWSRNSLQMYCRSFFSQKQLHGKNREQMHEMLHGIGKNWTTDLDPDVRNGTFIYDCGFENVLIHNYSVLPSYEAINDVVQKVMPKDKS